MRPVPIINSSLLQSDSVVLLRVDLVVVVVVPQRSKTNIRTNAGGRRTVRSGTGDPFFLVISQVFNPYLQARMTDAEGLKEFCKGLVGGGQYTGGGQAQPEQERPEPGVAPTPTNNDNGLGTMLHHHNHAAFPVSWFERDCDNPTVNSKQQQQDNDEDNDDARQWCLIVSLGSISFQCCVWFF